MFSSKMYLPHEKLKDWIKVYWFLKGDGKDDHFYYNNLLPDGCATILLVLDGVFNLSDYYEDGVLSRGIYIIPPCKINNQLKFSNNIQMIDIQLNPSIFYKLFKQPVSLLKNRVYTFDDLSLNFDQNILEQIYNLNDSYKIINLLNRFLFDLFYKKDFYADEIIVNINELYKIGDLDKFFNKQALSIRQLERKVKEFTGLTPKTLSRTARFYSILEQIKFKEYNLNFTQLAFENKFSDQSHFIREFKSFTKTSPTQFVKDIRSFPQYMGICNLTKLSKFKSTITNYEK